MSNSNKEPFNVYSFTVMLVSYAVFNIGDAAVLKEQAEKCNLKKLYDFALKHRIMHIVAFAFEKLGILRDDGGVLEDLGTDYMSAVINSDRFIEERKRIFKCFEQEKIQYLPLKGDIIAKMYPFEWMRNSCDIDILIHKEDLKTAIKALEKNLGFKVSIDSTNHDVLLESKRKVILELHYSLVDNEDLPKCRAILENVWDNAVCEYDGSYKYVLNENISYLYFMAHMAKHFLIGGCGIKSFIDLQFLKQNSKLNNEIIEKAGLKKFEAAMIKLSDYWFAGGETDEFLKVIEKYVFSGGAYGTFKNFVTISRNNSGGKYKHLLKRIFIPYKKMQTYYSSLKTPVLYPFYFVIRAFRVVFGKNSKKNFMELKYNFNENTDNSKQIENIIKELNL